MRRRDFLQNSSLGLIGLGVTVKQPLEYDFKKGNSAKNIIFMVSDGMSTGTLNMAGILRRMRDGRQSNWLSLYEQGMVTRGLMDMASASSLITDSAAASSSWGGGVRVKNGSLNTNEDGSENRPILQKFKKAGKAVGCVTTVPITHATPAGFCISNKKRGDQSEIALQYLPLKFDVMMGGGDKYFNASKRDDKTDAYGLFRRNGYQVVNSRNELLELNSAAEKPILGVFDDDGLPFSVDRFSSSDDLTNKPSLSEMAKRAIEILSKQKNGFVLQIEAGKVDWAAHANDASALIYDQLAFDDTIEVVMNFARTNKDTLVVITTDHGNANPGLFYGDKATQNFERLLNYKQTNEWLLNKISRSSSIADIIETHKAATGYAISNDEARVISKSYENLNEDGVYNAYKLPFKTLADIQSNYTSISWAGTNHSADFVELAMYGSGSENHKAFMKNSEMHNFLLKAANVNDLNVR